MDWVAQQGITTGLLTLWCRHTSASLTVQENADPAVRQDILAYFERLAFEDDPRNVHMFHTQGVPCIYIHSGYYE